MTLKICLALSVGVLSIGLNCQVAHAAPPNSKTVLSCSATPDGAEISVQIPVTMSAQYSVDGNEIVFKFAQNIGTIDLTPVGNCSPLISNVQNSFNQILFITASETTIAVDKDAASFVIRLTAPATATVESPAENAALAITQARAMYKTGDQDQAFTILDQALKTDPTNSDILQTLADYEHTAGRSQVALRLLEQSNLQNSSHPPSEMPLTETPLFEELSAPYRTTGHLGFEFLDGKNSYTERRYQLSASTPISDQLPGDVIRLKAESNNATFQNIAAPDGSIVSPSITRERYEGAYVHPFHESSELSIIASGAAQTAGGGVQVTSADRSGVSEFALQAHEPNWDYASTASFHGARDRAEATRVTRFSPDIPVNLGLALNRFSLDGDSNAATSGDVNASVGYILLREPATIQINYSLTGNYFIRHHERNLGSGDQFRTFPQESTEFHALTIGASYPITKIPGTPILYGFGGYAVDRLGGNTPEIGGGIRYQKWRGPEGSLEIGKSLSTVSDSTSQVRVVASLTWHF